MADIIEGEILEDGTIKTTTSKVTAPNHSNAEGLFSFLSKLMGGKTTRTRRGDHAHATHTHEQHERA